MTEATLSYVDPPPTGTKAPPVEAAPRQQFRSLRKLLTRLCVFGLINLAIFGLLELRLAKIPNAYARKEALLTAQAKEVEVLVLGSSHGYYAIDPAQFGHKGFNAAYIAQDLYYDSRIALKHLNDMPKLRQVIVPISYHTLETNLCDTPEDWRSFFYRRFYGIPRYDGHKRFDPRNWSLMLLYRNKEVFRFIASGFNINLCPNLRDNGFAATDDFAPITPEAGEARIEIHHHDMHEPRLKQNVVYLEQLFTALKARGVRIAIVSVPIHHDYSDLIEREPYDRMQAAIHGLQAKFGATYHDYMFDGRFDTPDYANVDHLNEAGAERFSRILREEVVEPAFAPPR